MLFQGPSCRALGFRALERHTVLRTVRVYCVLLEVQTEVCLDNAAE